MPWNRAWRPLPEDTTEPRGREAPRPSAATPLRAQPLPVMPLAGVNFVSFCAQTAQIGAVPSLLALVMGQRGADPATIGLVTAAPDDIDWDDELRLAIEERAAMSPDALTGLEANLRFAQKENMATRIFGRLTAWQNWIFQRPNAVGEKGALKVYGKGEKVQFDLNRV